MFERRKCFVIVPEDDGDIDVQRPIGFCAYPVLTEPERFRKVLRRGKVSSAVDQHGPVRAGELPRMVVHDIVPEGSKVARHPACKAVVTGDVDDLELPWLFLTRDDRGRTVRLQRELLRADIDTDDEEDDGNKKNGACTETLARPSATPL